jgi:MFS transporter, AAHS family, 4-hydroxybenzoate transporter
VETHDALHAILSALPLFPFMEITVTPLARLIALMLPIGSTIGAIVIGLLMDRYNPHVSLFCSYVLAACFTLMLGVSTGSVVLLVIAVFGAGIGTGGSQIGINALSAAYYPTASRATGVSWANAVCRIGSVVGSMVGGQLLSFGWALGAVYSTAAVPALAAAIAFFAKGRAGTRESPAVSFISTRSEA